MEETIHKNTQIRTLNYAKLLCLFVFLFVFFSVSFAEAATLYFSPSSGSFNVGQNFSVAVYVSSAEQAMNAASGVISFTQDKLEITSLSKSGSIFSLWVQEPLFSNSVGTVQFEGIVLNPGFIGSAGKIITINFKGKTVGSAPLSFYSGSVLANDGKGTNILASLGSVSYQLASKEITPLIPPSEIPSQPPTTPGKVPDSPIVSSLTHPDQEKWYSNNNPEFSWQLPSDVKKISYAIDQNPLTNPKFVAEGLVTKATFSNLQDGVWYFHINFKNQYGWGKLTHQKVLIDTQAPEPFKIIINDQDDFTNPKPILYFGSKDSLSGIEYYEIKIGEGDALSMTAIAIKDNPYKLPTQAPGKHSILVKAVDRAGNSTIAAAEVVITALEPPIITDFPKGPGIGDVLKISGVSKYPESTVTVFVKKEGEEQRGGDVKTDKEGKWSFIDDKTFEKGTYHIWAEITDTRGAKSKPTEKITIIVSLPSLLKFAKLAIDYLTTMVILIALIVFLILIIFYAGYRISLWRKKLRKETKEVEETVVRAFRALEEEVREQIEHLDKKKGLSRSERKIRDKLEEALEVSEAFISKEIKDILKELE